MTRLRLIPCPDALRSETMKALDEELRQVGLTQSRLADVALHELGDEELATAIAGGAADTHLARLVLAGRRDK